MSTINKTVIGKGFTANADLPDDGTTWSVALKGEKAAETWRSREANWAEGKEIGSVPVIARHLALVSENGASNVRPIWFGGWLVVEKKEA